MVTILDHFNRKIIRLNSSMLAPYAKRKNVIVNSFFLTNFPGRSTSNNHSSQQGAGKFNIEYAQIVCRVGCSDIKSV